MPTSLCLISYIKLCKVLFLLLSDLHILALFNTANMISKHIFCFVMGVITTPPLNNPPNHSPTLSPFRNLSGCVHSNLPKFDCNQMNGAHQDKERNINFILYSIWLLTSIIFLNIISILTKTKYLLLTDYCRYLTNKKSPRKMNIFGWFYV